MLLKLDTNMLLPNKKVYVNRIQKNLSANITKSKMKELDR